MHIDENVNLGIMCL